MKSFNSAALAALVVLVAVGPTFAAECSSMSEAKSVTTDHHMKIVATLPKTSTTYRFLGQDNRTKEFIGATVAMASCAFSQVPNADTASPWCKYMPDDDKRC